jgi:hypothetical protein
MAWEGETTHDGLTTVTVFARNNDHGQLPSYTVSSCTVNTSTCKSGVKGTINNTHVESLGVDV